MMSRPPWWSRPWWPLAAAALLVVMTTYGFVALAVAWQKVIFSLPVSGLLLGFGDFDGFGLLLGLGLLLGFGLLVGSAVAPVQPVWAGLVLPMPWLRSHS